MSTPQKPSQDRPKSFKERVAERKTKRKTASKDEESSAKPAETKPPTSSLSQLTGALKITSGPSATAGAPGQTAGPVTTAAPPKQTLQEQLAELALQRRQLKASQPEIPSAIPTAKIYSSPLYAGQQKMQKLPIDAGMIQMNAAPGGLDQADVKYLASTATKNTWIATHFIDRGTYGAVFQVLAGKDQLGLSKGQSMVAKVIKVNLNDRQSVGYKAALAREMIVNKELMVKAAHPNLLICNDLFKVIHEDRQERCYMIMELTEFGTMTKVMNWATKVPNGFSGAETRWLAQGITAGVGHLKSLGIAHCDIKPDNVLLFPNQDKVDNESQRFWPKLADFSNSFQVDPGAGDKTNKCPVRGYLCSLAFAPPEAFNEPNTYDGFTTDVYALAATFFFMRYRKTFFVTDALKYARDLYCKAHIDSVKQQQVNSWVSSKLEKEVPDKLMRDLLAKCWQEEPDKRLTIEQVMDHAWIKGVKK